MDSTHFNVTCAATAIDNRVRIALRDIRLKAMHCNSRLVSSCECEKQSFRLSRSAPRKSPTHPSDETPKKKKIRKVRNLVHGGRAIKKKSRMTGLHDYDRAHFRHTHSTLCQRAVKLGRYFTAPLVDTHYLFGRDRRYRSFFFDAVHGLYKFSKTGMRQSACKSA